MNRNELEAAIAEKTGLSRADVTKVLSITFESIAEALSRGDGVRLTGFGTFSVKETAAKEGRNPRTGEKMMIAASRRPSFKAGKTLVDTVKG